MKVASLLVSYHCLMPIDQFFSYSLHVYIMARTTYMLMRWWWCLFCTSRPTCMLSSIFIVLAHWNSSLCVEMSLNLDTFSWFWPNPSLFLLLSAMCLAAKTMISHTRGEHANHYTIKPWIMLNIMHYVCAVSPDVTSFQSSLVFVHIVQVHISKYSTTPIYLNIVQPPYI